MMKMGWRGRTDDIVHYLPLPRWIVRPICDWYERWLLGPEDYEKHQQDFHS